MKRKNKIEKYLSRVKIDLEEKLKEKENDLISKGVNLKRRKRLNKGIALVVLAFVVVASSCGIITGIENTISAIIDDEKTIVSDFRGTPPKVETSEIIPPNEQLTDAQIQAMLDQMYPPKVMTQKAIDIQNWLDGKDGTTTTTKTKKEKKPKTTTPQQIAPSLPNVSNSGSTLNPIIVNNGNFPK